MVATMMFQYPFSSHGDKIIIKKINPFNLSHEGIIFPYHVIMFMRVGCK